MVVYRGAARSGPFQSGGRVVIYESVIRAMNQPGGIVGRYMRGKTKELKAEAIARCPERTGALRRSIGASLRLPSGPHSSEGTVRAGGPDARYALAVLRGTGRISASDPPMWVPKYEGGPYPVPGVLRTWRSSVDGQPAQDFLGEALAAVVGRSKRVGVRVSKGTFTF